MNKPDLPPSDPCPETVPATAEAAWMPDENACRRISSAQLLAGQNRVVIDHAGQAYVLRLTRENKLILTK